jgi:hypothetical protein
MNSGEDKINMKIVAFDKIYIFVLQTFFIWSHIGVQNIDIPSRSTVHCNTLKKIPSLNYCSNKWLGLKIP